VGLWKDKRLKTWRFSFQYRGITHTGSGYQTRREAETARSGKRQEVKERKEQTGMAFSQLADAYLTDAERRFAEKTYKYKRYVYASFLRKNGDKSIYEISPQDVHAYLSTRSSNHNYNVHRKDLSALFSWGKQKLKLPILNPCTDIDKMPHTAERKAPPSEGEILKLILAASPGDERDILLTCLHTLGRIDEVLRLRWEDVNLDQKTVTLWTRKRRGGAYEPDALPMSDDLYDVLKVRFDGKKQDGWVFFNDDTRTRFMHRPKMMRSICKRAGTPLYGFHALRHFMATHLADQEKVRMKTVQGLLRHKNLKTTEIYLHPIDENARTAVDQIKGKFTLKNAFPHTEAAHNEEAN